MVDIGGYRLHLDCEGSGSPVVIFEAAVGNPGLSWALVQPQVASFTRACAYDRAGIGWSDPSPRPRTVEDMAGELKTLLETAGIPGPYVLVGYSSGGWQGRYYAHTYPQDLAGMVLVDSAHEDQASRLGAEGEPAAARLFRLIPLIARMGIPALVPELLPVPGKGYLPPEDVRAIQALMAAEIGFADAMAAEMEAVWENLARVRQAEIRSLGDVPLVVLAHTNLEAVPGVELSPEAGRIWLELQAELASLSPQGRLVRVEDSGHDILYQRPELVVEAIRTVVSEARLLADP
jgi:pimeloyl-ACP methyl ester carboxylesterase